MAEAQVYEVVRNAEDSEEALTASLEAAGFIIVKNYDALPCNYRVSAKTGMERTAALEALAAIPELDNTPSAGDELVSVGDAAKHTNLTKPLDIFHRGADPVFPQGLLGKQKMRYTTQWGRQWGVALCTVPDPTAPLPFNAASDLTYNFTLARNGNGVIYYILDTGVQVDHPEFDEGEYGSRVEWVFDGYYKTNDDDGSHGTGMSSCGCGKTLGAATQASIYAAKGLGADGSGVISTLIDGINAIVAHYNADTTGRPAVMNNSWSTGSSISSVSTAIGSAADAGIVAVCSAGNDAKDAGTGTAPGGLSSVLSVGAVDIDMRMSSFSNWGSVVDVFAPGRDILQGSRGHSLAYGDGTSPASGMTSGFVACMLQGYRRLQNAAEVTAVMDYVKSQAMLTRLPRYGTYGRSATTKVVWLDPREQAEVTRIPGIQNMLTPNRAWIGGESFQRQVSRPEGLAPALTPLVHGRAMQAPIEIGPDLKPTATTDGTDISGRGYWQYRNQDFSSISNTTDVVKLGQVIDTNGYTANSRSFLIEGRAETLVVLGSSDASSAMQHITLPLEMARDEMRGGLQDVFTNVDWVTLDATGWTLEKGAIKPYTRNALSAYDNWAYMDGQTSDTTLSQTQPLSAVFADAEVDSGKAKMAISWHQGSDYIQTAPDIDESRVRLYALDGDGAVISVLHDTGNVFAANIGWLGKDFFHGYLPAGTRQIKIQVDWYLVSGSVINAPVSNFEGWFWVDGLQTARVREEVETGRAWLGITYLSASYSMVEDDQLRAQVDFYDKDKNIISSAAEADRSPYFWVEHTWKTPIPQGAVIADVQFVSTLRAGTAINAYYRDVSLQVSTGAKQYRIGSISPTASTPPNLKVTSVAAPVGPSFF